MFPIKLQRLTRAELLKDDPICMKTTIFSKVYDPDAPLTGFYTQEPAEIAFVVSGSGTLCVLNQTIPCQAGGLYITQPDTPHNFFTSSADAPITVLRFWFDPRDWFTDAFADAGSPHYCYGVFSEGALTVCALLNKETRGRVLAMLNDISQEVTEKKPEWAEAVRAHLAVLFILVGRYVGNAIRSLPAGQTKEWQMAASAVRIAGKRFADSELTLKSIADSLYVSQSHLSRLFQRFTGEAFSVYLRNLRIDHACRLLAKTDLTVAEIAQQCGMKDLPTFYQIFRTQRGMTPHQYRTLQSGTDKPGTPTGDRIPEKILQSISERLQLGDEKGVCDLIRQGMEQGLNVLRILDEGLLRGMSAVSEKFKTNEVFVPEVLIAARAMNRGMELLKPELVRKSVAPVGKVCIGTVQGDLHDIGKNLVKMMMEGRGLEVIDLGTDVPPETFVRTAVEQDCRVICCSALLTTTMGVIGDVVKEAEKAGIRDKVKILIGGAPVTQEFCEEVGADYYTPDAASAAETAFRLLRKETEKK